jgi:hypothetical protein
MFGPILIITIWVVGVIVFLMIVTGCWLVGDKTQNWLPLKITLGIALCFVLLVGGWYGLGFVPSYVFYEKVGFGPTADVKELRGYRLSVLGQGKAYLRFRAGPATVQRLVGTGYHEVPKEKFAEWANAREKPPEWWQPLAGNPTHFYQIDHLDNGYAMLSTAIVSYDESSGVVHFHWFGVN